MTSFTQRVIGAAKLDVHTYEEVEADTTAMGQAMGVVALSSVAAGIGVLSVNRVQRACSAAWWLPSWAGSSGRG